MKLYPNPTSNQATLSYVLKEAAALEIQLYDALGREIRTLYADEQSPGIHQLEIQRKEEASGLYYLKLKTKKSAWIVQLVWE